MPHFRDEARWEDDTLVSVDVGARNKAKKYIFNEYHYATKGERQLAELLHHFDIPFTPDVPFSLATPDGGTRRFVPDFVFDKKAYVWCARTGGKLVHGIEAKGKTHNGEFSAKALENVRLLYEQRGIRILLLSNSQIKQYFNNHRLPLKPFEPPNL